jgi:hypothetical protein
MNKAETVLLKNEVSLYSTQTLLLRSNFADGAE